MFCPRCGAILIPKKDDKKNRMKCSCGYVSRGVKGSVILKEKVQLNREETIDVVDKKIETLPKVNEECKKCGNKTAYYWLAQTRSADEAETRFFECTKCKYRWRSYT